MGQNSHGENVFYTEAIKLCIISYSHLHPSMQSMQGWQAQDLTLMIIMKWFTPQEWFTLQFRLWAYIHLYSSSHQLPVWSTQAFWGKLYVYTTFSGIAFHSSTTAYVISKEMTIVYPSYAAAEVNMTSSTTNISSGIPSDEKYGIEMSLSTLLHKSELQIHAN